MSRRGHYKKTNVPSTVVLSVDQWPMRDRILWEHARRRGDVLEGGGRAANWATRTVQNVEQSYGHWLKWLSDYQPRVLELDPIERATRANVGLYVEGMQARLSPFTVQINLQRLGQMMVACTETKEFGWLFRAANRLRPKSVRNKRSKMQPSYRLADLGHQLMEGANALPATWHCHRSVRFRNGLIVALLAYRPIRLANLASITIDQHLVRTDVGYALVFGAHETKQREILEFTLPAVLIEPIAEYLKEHRPALLKLGSHAGTAGDRLWVSRDGGPLEASGIAQVVLKETKAAFGQSINPHLFRDCAATTVALDDPEHAYMIAPILGHSSMTTSERHYNQARTVDAGRQYHAVLAKTRRKPPTRTTGADHGR